MAIFASWSGKRLELLSLQKATIAKQKVQMLKGNIGASIQYLFIYPHNVR